MGFSGVPGFTVQPGMSSAWGGDCGPPWGSDGAPWASGAWPAQAGQW